MPLKTLNQEKFFPVLLTLCFIFLSGIIFGYFSNHVFSENARFKKFTEELLKKISGSSLTFHYSVAHPEKAGLKTPQANTWNAKYKHGKNIRSLSGI